MKGQVNSIFVSIRKPQRKTLVQLTSINSARLVNKKGFSLFEFMVVVVIFSILVSVLIQKLLIIHDDAHEANVQLTASSLQRAVNLTHQLWQSYGSINKVTLLKGYGNDNVIMSSKGWPIGALFESDRLFLNKESLSGDVDDCKNLWRALLKHIAPDVKRRADNSSNYLAEFNQGICRYKYLLSEEQLKIEYDLATGRVIPFF